MSAPPDRLTTLRAAGMWPAADPARLAALDDREFAYLVGVMRGKTLKEIARVECRSPRTVGNMLEHLYRKLEVRNMQGLIAYAYSALAAETVEVEP